MKVKIIKIIFVAVLMSSCIAFADTWTDPETGRTWTYRMTGDTAEITQGQYSDWTGDLTIPGRLGDIVVTSIGDFAFFNCGDISGPLTIPNSVANIGYNAFGRCEKLSGSLIIPSGVTNIGISAFYSCSNLCGSVMIPKGVRKIEQGVFAYCSKLSGPLVLPDDLTSIGSGAFSWCSGLTGSLVIPNSVTNIGERAFAYCSGLTGSLVIPSGVINIGDSAFSYCSGFSGDLNIQCSVEHIDCDVFSGCRGLDGSLTISDAVKDIGDRAFSGCGNLTGVLIIPNSVTNIGQWVFSGCSKLEGVVTIPNGVKCVSHGAFSSCKKLSGVVIMDGVENIEGSAFSLCSSLKYALVSDTVVNIEEKAFPTSSSFKTLYLSKNYSGNLNTGSSYGKWPVVRYEPYISVSFDSLGGDGVMPITVKVASVYENLPVATKLGFKFEGWNYNGVRVTDESVVNITQDHVLTAQWKPNSYSVSFDSNGGRELFDGKEVLFASTYGDLPIPSRVGHSFTGWYCGGEEVSSNTIVSTPSNHVLVAQWSVNRYPMTFNANGGNGGGILMQEYDTPVVAPSVSRTGYSFVEWQPSISTNVPAEALEFVAQWSANNYTVSFDLCGGVGEYEPIAIAFDGNYSSLPIPTREGYAFAGWSINGNIVDENTVLTTASNHVLTAVWMGNTYNAALDANGGNVEPSSVEVVFGGEYGVLPAPVRSGYTFSGWSLTGQLVNAHMAVSTPSNHVLVSEWIPCQYNVSFDANGGILLDGQSAKVVTYDDVYGDLPEPTRMGYTFAGWWLYGHNVESGTLVEIASNHVIMAHWTANRYVVELNPNGGSLEPSDSTVEVVFDSEYGELPCPVRIGYGFIGWTTSLVDGTVIDEEALATTNQILYALWEANQYQIIYDANNGSDETHSEDAVYDDDAEITTNHFTWMGHVFLGWATSANGEVVYEPGQTVRNLTSDPDGDVTLYAVWGPLVVATPVISPGNGSSFLGDTCLVTISCATDGADVYYSTRGTPPRIRDSYRYTGAFTIGDTTQIMAIALKENVTSEVAIATITRRDLTLPEAAGATDLAFATGGDAEWLPMVDATTTSGFSVKSGEIGCAPYGSNTISWLSTEVVGAGTFAFRWKVDCEHDYTGMCLWDHLAVFTNGIEVARIDSSQDWADVSFSFTDGGTHSVRWVFVKDDEDDDDVTFEDCGWVSGVSWVPAVVTVDMEYGIGEMPESMTVRSGVTLSVKMDHEPIESEIVALSNRITIAPKSEEQKAEYFKVVGSYDATAGAVVLKVVLEDEAIGLNETVQEVLSAVVNTSFVGGMVSLKETKPGLYYGIVAVDDLSKMESASEKITFVKAGVDGAVLTMPKPEGSSAFFKVVVSDEGM